ncbi:hypothetical protein SRHO_G00025540 [Serrasalmus rhombeus]
MEILGKWQTVCQFGALALVVEFLVADIPLGILLGMDFLQKYGVVIDLGGKQCTIMGKRLTLLLREGGAHTYSVSVHNDVVIPPRSEVIISGIVEGLLGDSMECMFEPSSLTQGDIMIARVVCQTRGGFLPVRVLNVADNAQTLRQGMTLGTLDTAVEVEGTGEVMQRVDPKVGIDGWTIDDLVAQLRLDEKGFTSSQVRAIRGLLGDNFSVFSRNEADLGRTHLTFHEIDTGLAKPVKLAPRRVPLHLQQEVSDHIKDMQEQGIIQPSCSPWAAPVVPVRKKDGGLRFCVDYRKLNEVTRKDVYPLPRIDEALDSLANAQWFSTLDLASGYWQVEVASKDKCAVFGPYYFSGRSYG